MLKKSCAGDERGEEVKGEEGRRRENAGPRNFTFRGCETSPLRRNGPQAAAGANDILPRYFALILRITLLVSTDLVFEQLREQIAPFCGINPGYVTRTIVRCENYETMRIKNNVSYLLWGELLCHNFISSLV